MVGTLRCWSFLIMLAFGSVLSSQAQERVKKKSIAVLAQDKAPAWTDLVVQELNGALAKKGFEPIEREYLKKVLAEHKLSAAGMVKNPLSAGKLTGARYFAYIHGQDNAGTFKIQALLVETSSGNVLSEGVYPVPPLDDEKKIRNLVQEIANRCTTAEQEAADLNRLPTAAVIAVTNRSESGRLRFLESNVWGILEDILAARGYRVLRRLHAERLAKETALSVSGMVRPDAKVLAESADVSIRAEFRERPSDEFAFEDTPIKAEFFVTTKDGKSQRFAQSFTLKTMATLPVSLKKQIPAGGDVGKRPSKKKSNAEARAEAARLLAQLKVLHFGASKEEHQKNFELAQRIVYLDPSAKEAYYVIAISYRRFLLKGPKPWGAQKDILRKLIAAYRTYLQFPRTEKKRVSDLLYELNSRFLYARHKNDPEVLLPLIAEEINWHHSVEPNKPCVREPTYAVWWARDPKRRLKWYDWIDTLYTPKAGTSVATMRRWKAHMQLHDYKAAAKWYHEGVVLQKRAPLEGWMVREKIVPNTKLMARHLDARKSRELLDTARKLFPTQMPLQAMYGDVYGDKRDLYGYSFRSNKVLLAKASHDKVKVTPMDLKEHIYSTFVLRTGGDLWVHAAASKTKTVLYRSPKAGEWQHIELPNQVASLEDNLLHACRSGDEVFFAIRNAIRRHNNDGDHGIHVYHLKKQTWRRIAQADGLGGRWASFIVKNPGKNELFFYGDTFLNRYANGKCFLMKRRATNAVSAVLLTDQAELASRDERLLFRNRKTGKTVKVGLGALEKSVDVPHPRYFWFHSFQYGVHATTFVGGRFYAATTKGLARLSTKGQIERFWYPKYFYHWKELGAEVEGNCPLPSAKLTEVIADDQDPELLWLVSHYNAMGRTYRMYRHFRPREDKSCMSFITCFNTRTEQFSEPLRTPRAFVRAEARGDFLYLAGLDVERVKKSNWKTTIQARPKDRPPKVTAPDTIVGRAAKAYFSGNREEAADLLQKALDQNIAPQIVGSMLKAIKKMKRK